MFEFDAAKLFVIGIVALIVIGPKELPRVLRQLGQMIGKMRRMAADFQGQFMDAMREAEIDDLKKDINKVADSVQLDSGANPFNQLAQDINKSLADNPVADAASNAASPAAEAAPVDMANFMPELPPELPPVTSADFMTSDASAFEAAPEPVPVPEPGPAPVVAVEAKPIEPISAEKGQA